MCFVVLAQQQLITYKLRIVDVPVPLTPIKGSGNVIAASFVESTSLLGYVKIVDVVVAFFMTSTSNSHTKTDYYLSE